MIEPDKALRERVEDVLLRYGSFLKRDIDEAVADVIATIREHDAARIWTKTADRLPEKPGKARYELIECLIVVKGRVEKALWNCEHMCWDDEHGDDFRYRPKEPTHWMPLPAPPAAQPEEPRDDR